MAHSRKTALWHIYYLWNFFASIHRCPNFYSCYETFGFLVLTHMHCFHVRCAWFVLYYFRVKFAYLLAFACRSVEDLCRAESFWLTKLDIRNWQHVRDEISNCVTNILHVCTTAFFRIWNDSARLIQGIYHQIVNFRWILGVNLHSEWTY